MTGDLIYCQNILVETKWLFYVLDETLICRVLMYPPKTVFHTVMIPYHRCDGLSLPMRIHGHCIDPIKSQFLPTVHCRQCFQWWFLYICLYISVFREIMNVKRHPSQIRFYILKKKLVISLADHFHQRPSKQHQIWNTFEEVTTWMFITVTLQSIFQYEVRWHSRPFVKDFEALVKWTSNFWNQLIHRDIYPSTIIRESNKHNYYLINSKSTDYTLIWYCNT